MLSWSKVDNRVRTGYQTADFEGVRLEVWCTSHPLTGAVSWMYEAILGEEVLRDGGFITNLGAKQGAEVSALTLKKLNPPVESGVPGVVEDP